LPASPRAAEFYEILLNFIEILLNFIATFHHIAG